jgi:putative oxidoreductase
MSLSQWFSPTPREPQRSLDLVRWGTAFVLLTHPLHALLHREDATALAAAIAAHRLPAPLALAWAALAVQLAASLLLLAGRFVWQACAAHLAVLAVGIWVLHWPDWYAAGGSVTEGHPGAELSAVVMAALGGVLLARLPVDGEAARTRALRRGLDLVRIGAVLVMVTHPLHLAFDPEGIREFGHALEQRGFPFGVLLVCTLTGLQLFGVASFLTRRLVVPGALGMLFVHGMGMVLHHRLRWFAVGPGEEGNEFPAMLVLCFFAVMVAHWPARESAAGRRGLPAEARV